MGPMKSDDYDLEAIARQFGTPLFVFSGDAIRERVHEFCAAFGTEWPRFELMPSLKACPILGIRALLSELDCGCDVFGPGEFEGALRANVPPSRISLNGSIKDEAIIRMDLRETLVEEGYDVVGETGRGDEAVQLVRDLSPDLAILDVKMPGMDGLEVAAILTAEKLCGVLMLTAFSQREVVEQARDAGALAFLVKPFQRSDLVPAIEVAFGRFRELRDLTGEIDSLGEQLESRKIIDRAKSILMNQRGLSEQDAYALLRSSAMNQGRKIVDVAQALITASDLLGGGL